LILFFNPFFDLAISISLISLEARLASQYDLYENATREENP
jgi:hypothetical protein